MRNLKWKISIMLSISMLIACMPFAYAQDYTDIQGHWAEEAITRWSGYGVVSGNGDGEFNPDGEMTRAQAAQVFANLLGLSEKADVSKFSDVESDSWYSDAIAKCVAANIMSGVGDDKMDPNGTITREMFFVMFARALKISPEDVCEKDFSDTDSVASWAQGYVNALINHNYVSGITETTIEPKFEINRASVMSLLNKTITSYEKGGKVVVSQDGSINIRKTAIGGGISGGGSISSGSGGSSGGSGNSGGGGSSGGGGNSHVHDYKPTTVTCEEDGYEECSCGAKREVKAYGHIDADSDGFCDRCYVKVKNEDNKLVVDYGDYGKALWTLEALDVFHRYDDGRFRSEGDLTRAEVATIIVMALGMTEEAKAAASTPSPYPDVNEKASWATGYINVCVELGIVSDMGDGNFAPTDRISYADMCVMLEKLTGYADYAQALGNYPEGYIAMAETAGINKGVEHLQANENLSRGEFAQMLYNALTIPVLAVKEETPEGKVYERLDGKGSTGEYKTLLSDKLKGFEISAIVYSGNEEDVQLSITNTEYDNANTLKNYLVPVANYINDTNFDFAGMIGKQIDAVGILDDSNNLHIIYVDYLPDVITLEKVEYNEFQQKLEVFFDFTDENSQYMPYHGVAELKIENANGDVVFSKEYNFDESDFFWHNDMLLSSLELNIAEIQDGLEGEHTFILNVSNEYIVWDTVLIPRQGINFPASLRLFYAGNDDAQQKVHIAFGFENSFGYPIQYHGVAKLKVENRKGEAVAYKEYNFDESALSPMYYLDLNYSEIYGGVIGELTFILDVVCDDITFDTVSISQYFQEGVAPNYLNFERIEIDEIEQKLWAVFSLKYTDIYNNSMYVSYEGVATLKIENENGDILFSKKYNFDNYDFYKFQPYGALGINFSEIPNLENVEGDIKFSLDIRSGNLIFDTVSIP